ncbi:hypothetical protein [Rhizobium sp. HT1-10]|uniref:hypothetical protein n=1 Tax=Rhizobium sp. HT1-10 TaxID=3111638 RepID=UPI003C180F6A
MPTKICVFWQIIAGFDLSFSSSKRNRKPVLSGMARHAVRICRVARFPLEALHPGGIDGHLPWGGTVAYRQIQAVSGYGKSATEIGRRRIVESGPAWSGSIHTGEDDSLGRSAFPPHISRAFPLLY